ncbi:pre-rRNA-processing protein TSR1 homolog [Harpegnathos saltator]|uniref:Pre-rRNA-processing protein TSR1 homolog n=1 Tax=Harpegnathos saltator TaxID=610380 RepID=E2BPW1_HARSA|nr:pre-rRNA-processing protein TSR1 homolog [Harpegnathos saltator]EFN82312.1 Pre-rRNA-processing protein TSR1-like protein [Harpegnathos saltator]
MGITKQKTHRPGALKQANKQHKTGRHRSKGVINNEQKGKQSTAKTLSKCLKKTLGKDARRHQLSQIRKKKCDEILKQKRNNGSISAPHLISVIPLQSDTNIQDIISIIKSMNETANIATSACGVLHIGIPRFKQRYSIIVPPVGNVFATLDAAKVANTILFVTSVANDTNDTKKEAIDDWGKEIIVSCLTQGLSAAIFAVHNMQKLHIKKHQEYKQSLQSIVSKWIPVEKVFELDTEADCLNILCRAGSQKQRNIFYRNKRPHLLAEKFSFKCDEDSSDFGTLSVTGYLRGSLLSVNDLVHIPGFGDFQMSCIEGPRDPYPIEHPKCKNHFETESEMEDPVSPYILQIADPKHQESLESENIPDPMDAEQTWPTEKELAEAAARTKKKIVKIVPKGTSEYQAAWIPDEDAEALSIDSDNESEDNMSVEEARSVNTDSDKNIEDDEEYETITISEAPLDEERYDKNLDMLEEKQTLEILKEAKLDAQFPDEVDTPQNMLAKTRFQKYRGLKSLRNSFWDPKENLPTDYSRIFQLKNFDHTRRRIYKQCDNLIEGIQPGRYITIKILRVSSNIFKTFAMVENQPLIVFGLLPYENKISLLNIMLKHSHNYTQPIKSKDRLVFQCGFRRFAACPIFSQHTASNKHKYERYFHPESTVVASMYAPITFPPCPTLCYIENKSGKLELAATGNVLSCNPDRIVVKRVILSGHPYKVNKRSVVVRFMFFHREDIEWFKPVELRTKYGRKGHIKESLGTHGHMKCVFNGRLKSQDTILMNLYKRIFPKWTYEPLLLTQLSYNSEIMYVE